MIVPTASADSWNRLRYMILAMFCAECRAECQAEYRSGFTRCSDCDVDLVPHEALVGLLGRLNSRKQKGERR